MEHVDEAPVEELELLTLEEQQMVEHNPTILDQYDDWALSKSPDHAVVYSQSLGPMLLSAAYGDRCFVNLRWGLQRTNLWTIILGDTTRTHKSSAKNLFLRFVHAIEEQELEEIDIGSDATAEKLISVLGERDGLVSLLHTDEINGFFQENLVKKYRAGTLET